MFYSQPHSITVNWFDVSSALSPHNMSVRHLLEEQIANEDNSYAIKTVKCISLIMKNNMVSIVDSHVVKSTIILQLLLDFSLYKLPRLKA